MMRTLGLLLVAAGVLGCGSEDVPACDDGTCGAGGSGGSGGAGAGGIGGGAASAGTGGDAGAGGSSPFDVTLVADLRTDGAGSSPTGFVSFLGKVHFLAEDADGYALFASTTTEATLVARLPAIDAPVMMGVAGNRLYFRMNDGIHGEELWSSDGTQAGTAMVTDLTVGELSTTFSGAHATLGDEFLFVRHSVGKFIVYGSQGTAASTKPLFDDAVAGKSVVVSGSRVFFATPPSHASGSELWVYEPGQGTRLVRDIVPGASGSTPAGLFPFKSGVLFFASTPETGIELWYSDGSAAGTQLIDDLNPGPASSTLIAGLGMEMKLGGDGQAYFAASRPDVGREVFATDGTTIELVADLVPGPTSGNPYTAGMTTSGNNLYVLSIPTTERRLFVTSGNGATLLKEVGADTPTLAPGPGGSAYFLHSSDSLGRELYRTDGTAAGTALVADRFPGPGSGASGSLVANDGHVFFACKDETDGYEPCRVTGTAIAKLANLHTGNAASSPHVLGVTVDGKVAYFSALDADGRRSLYKTDGAAGQTTRVKAFDGDGVVTTPTTRTFGLSGDTLFFVAHEHASGREYWASDGTETGTRLLVDALPGPDSGAQSASEFVEMDGQAYLQLMTPEHGLEVWKSDGTPAGTVRLTDVAVGPEHGAQGVRLAWKGHVYFTCRTGKTSFRGLCRTTPDGVVEPVVAEGTVVNGLTAFQDQLYFGGLPSDTAPPVPRGLWKTSGTLASTVHVAAYHAAPLNLQVHAGKLVMRAQGGTLISDGTNLEVVLTTGPTNFAQFLPFSESLFFIGGHGAFGAYLTDLSMSGTELLTPLRAPKDNRLLSAAPCGGWMCFAGDDGEHGTELFATLGSSQTLLVRDLLNGPKGSSPTHITSFKDGALFAADDGEHGNELWFVREKASTSEED